MTFYSNDFLVHSRPTKSYVETASGETILVSGGGSIAITPHVTLKNCLFIPSLSTKLLSNSQLTKELDCVVLMCLILRVTGHSYSVDHWTWY